MPIIAMPINQSTYFEETIGLFELLLSLRRINSDSNGQNQKLLLITVINNAIT